MKLLQILVGTLLALFSTAFSEVTVKIISPEPGERIEPCQDVTFVADVQTTEGEQVDRVYFYNRLQSSTPFGYDNSAPWEKEMKQIKSGNYSITAAALLADRTQIESVPLMLTVGDSIAPEERLYNGGFYDCDSTIAPWGLHKWPYDEGSVGFDSIPELGNCIKINVGTILDANIRVSLYQDVKVEKDHTYELSFLAYMPTKRRLRVQVLNMASWDQADWLYSSIADFEELQKYSRQFTITDVFKTEMKYTLMIRAESMLPTDQNPFYIKWVSLKDMTPQPSTEVSLKVFSSDNSEINQGDVIRPCQNITLQADVNPVDGAEVNRVLFYNDDKAIGQASSSPWEREQQLNSGCYNITAVALIEKGGERTRIASEPFRVFVTSDSIAAGECLYNGAFDCGTISPWEFWVNNANASAEIHIQNTDDHFGGKSSIMVDIQKASFAPWHVQFYQQNIPIDSGHTYKYSFWAYTPEEKQIGFSAGDGTGTNYYLQIFPIINGLTEYSGTLTTRTSTTNILGISFGLGNSEVPFYLANVSVIDLTVPDTIYFAPEPDTTSTSIKQNSAGTVKNYELLSAYPNPFNPTTTIAYNLQRPGNVKLVVYNALGKRVAELVNKNQVEGSHSVLFDAQHLPTGIYLYQLQVDGEFSQMKKMVLLK